jgi:2,4-dienoyl-CoA reductase-like NADH-dependent reductase (Old Yellow Enzyme family)
MDLLSPVTLGDIELANRVVMASLTRLRSGPAGVPGELVVEHYRQRAGVGLIVTEGTYPDAESQAYPGQPGTERALADRRGQRHERQHPHRSGGRSAPPSWPRW